MGRKKKNASTLVPHEELKKLWTTIPIREWLFLFNEVSPQFKWELANNSSIRGLCPYHMERTPSFIVSTNRRFAKCFGSCQKFVDNPVALVSKLMNISYTDAQMQLIDRFNLSDSLGKYADGLKEYNDYQEVKKSIAVALKSVMEEGIRTAFDGHLNYMLPGFLYLVKARGLSVSNLPNLPVAIFPKPEHLAKYIEKDEHKSGAQEYFAKEYNNVANFGSLIFHFNTTPGTISKFKIRFKDSTAIENYFKVNQGAWTDPYAVSALDAGKFIQSSRDAFYIADKFAQDVGLFGLYKYATQIGRADANVYITEGEFDALSVMDAQDSQMRPDFIILSTGGRANMNVTPLYELGIRNIWLVQDHPSKSGDEYAKSFLYKKENFEGTNFSTRVFLWPINIHGSDLSEAVQRNGYETILQALWHDRDKTFENARTWILSKCDAELEHIHKTFKEDETEIFEDDSETDEVKKVQLVNLIEEKRTKIKTALATWVRYLTTPEDRASFVQSYSIQEGIELAQMDGIAAQVYSLHTLEGAYERFLEAMQESFSVAYTDSKANGAPLWLWSKKTHTVIQLLQDVNSMTNTIALCTGVEYYKWINALAGNSTVLYDASENKTELEVYNMKMKNSKVLMDRCFNFFFTKAKSRTDMAVFGQGIHYADLPSEVRRKNCMYIVNGRLLFKGTFKKDHDNIEWEQINNCTDNELLFKLKKHERWSHIESTSDLYNANGLDIGELFNQVRKIVDGWKFKDHDLIGDYLTAYIMALPAMAAIGPVNITYITGESESGKTSFSRGLLGGGYDNRGAYEVLNILESATIATDATEASMYQLMDRSTLLFGKDEAESTDSSSSIGHAARTKSIFAILNSIAMGGAMINRGSADANNLVQYYLRMPVLFAGINTPTDPVFMSRVVLLETVKEVGRPHLDTYIASHFREEEIDLIRKRVTIALLPYIGKIKAIRAQLRKEFSQIRTVQVSNRFTENLLTPLAVLELIKGNAKDLYAKYILRNKVRLEAIHGSGGMNELINACLFNKTVRVQNEAGVFDLASPKSLILNGDINVLNSSDCGVFYIEALSAIVIVWQSAKYSVLERTKYASYAESTLKEIAAKSTHVIADIDSEKHEFIKQALGQRELKNSNFYTVVRIAYLVEDDIIEMEEKDYPRYQELQDTDDEEDGGNAPLVASLPKPPRVVVASSALQSDAEQDQQYQKPARKGRPRGSKNKNKLQELQHATPAGSKDDDAFNI